MAIRILLALALAACASPATASPQSETLSAELPDILPLRERAKLEDQWLKRRLDTVVPALMREEGIDMWILVAREYLEDPVVATMLDAESMHARRRTILLFFDPGGGKPVERLTVSRYGMGGLFEPAWDPGKEPDQWRRLADIVAEREPRKIAVNSSAATAFGDGLTLSQYEELMAALPEAMRSRVVKTPALAVGWLETRIPEEMAVYPKIVRIAHAIIAEGFSDRTIRPGVTTADDLVWWFRERISGLGLSAWFQPSVGISRKGAKGMLEGDTVIERGDMLWTDFGITYLGLNTDTQHLGYVLKEGEKDAPAGLKRGLAAANAAQDAVVASFAVGRSGNEVLALARRRADGAGVKASIYSHPIGFHGHGAGPSIGFWDNQQADPRGVGPVRANTAWSVELSARAGVPEWGGQEVEFRLEEDAFFDGRTVRYLDGRQERFHLIGAR